MTDAGANVISAVSSLNDRIKKNYLHWTCATHLLHLVVSKYFPFQRKKKVSEDEDYYPSEDEEDIPSEIRYIQTEEERLFNLLIRVRKANSWFSKSILGSTYLKNNLKEENNSKISKLIKPNATRWNSFYFTLKRLMLYFIIFFFFKYFLDNLFF